MPSEESRKRQSIRRMLEPASIAVVGATPRPQYGGRFLRSVLESKDKVRVYPVNPRYQEILGVPCYPSLADLPESPDLVGIIVPYHQVLSVLKQSADVGAGAAIVVSAGFAERGSQEGNVLQDEIGDFASASGLRVSGPNCLGAANVLQGVWPSSHAPDPRLQPGPVALVSQSGATAFGPLTTRAVDLGLGYSHIISTGNEADLESSDFIDYLLDEPHVRVVACFIEGLKDGRKFLDAAKKALRLGKSIALIKVGRSPVGATAARSHTAALTGSDEVQNALFRQFGVTRCEDYDDLIQTAHLLAYAPAPTADGVAVVSHSGGISSLIADDLGHAGIFLPPLSETAEAGLNEILSGFGWAANPADITGVASRKEFADVLALLEQEPQAGALLIATAGTPSQAEIVMDLKAQTSKPLVFLSTGGDNVDEGLAMLREAHVPVFNSPSRAAKSLASLFGYHQRRRKFLDSKGASSPGSTANAVPQPSLPAGPTTMTEHAAKIFLSHWGITPTREVQSWSLKDAVEAAEAIGFPVALKLESPHVPHKTEAGVVRLNVQTPNELRQAYGEIVANGLTFAPQTKGAPVLVQEMVEGGVEVIAGISQDPQFGPILLFGIGGVLVEVYRDVAMRSCPITEADAREMLEEVRGHRLLQGFRGAPEADLDALVGSLLALSQMAVDLNHRRPELDVNPLIVLPRGQGVKAVDAFLTLS